MAEAAKYQPVAGHDDLSGPTAAPHSVEMKSLNMTEREDSAKGGSRRFLYIAASAANLSVFGVGTTEGWTSPVLPRLQNETYLEDNPFGRTITDEEASWIGSLMGVGAIFGPLLAGFLSERFGRKKSLLLACGLPLIVSYTILGFGNTVWLYYIARFIAGFALGGVFVVLPNFNSEIAEDSIRGAVSSSMALFEMSGTLFAFIVGPYMSVQWFSLICGIGPAVFLVMFTLVVPETPHYLISVGNHDSALKALQKFRHNTESGVQKELEEIKMSVEDDMKNRGSFLEIFKSRALIKAGIISFVLIAAQQFTGIACIVFYSESIFIASKSTIPSELATIVVGIVQTVTTVFTPLFVDRLGRRMLLLTSAIGVVLTEVILGLYFFLEPRMDVSSFFWLPIAMLMVYITVYNFGFGPLPWTVMAEVFPSRVKSGASTATSVICFTLLFVMTKFFAQLNDVIGMSGTFWMFAGCTTVAAIFVGTYLVETKGKSFQEIQSLLAQ